MDELNPRLEEFFSKYCKLCENKLAIEGKLRGKNLPQEKREGLKYNLGEIQKAIEKHIFLF